MLCRFRSLHLLRTSAAPATAAAAPLYLPSASVFSVLFPFPPVKQGGQDGYRRGGGFGRGGGGD